MKKLLLYLSDLHSEILKGFLLLISVLVIVIALPKEAKFKYEFQKGKNWPHQALISPFDFAINKSPEEINQERSEIMNNLHPYFRIDTTIQKQAFLNFSKDFNTRLNNEENKKKAKVNKFQEETGLRILRTIYEKGLLENNHLIENKREDYTIVAVKGNIAEEFELNDFFNIHTAISFIESSLKSSPKADIHLLKPLLESQLLPNVVYDENSTQKAYQQQIDNISLTHGMIHKGEPIIYKGDFIDNEKYQILESLRAAFEKNESGSDNYLLRLGQFILVGITLLLLLVFLASFRRDIFIDNLKTGFIFLNIVLFTLIYIWVLKNNKINHYIVPFCIVPIIIRTFFDTRVALFTHFILVLLVGFIAPNGFEFVFLQITAGMVAIFSIVSMRKRSQLFISAGVILLTYFVTYIGLSLVHEVDFSKINYDNGLWFAANCLLILFAYPLIFIYEKLFGFISDVSLLELSDTNSTLLRELALKAPGTFHHSIQVANLAEAAAFKIGGNTLLVRTGALYHDIGKMDMAMYFIENKNSYVNPHDELSFNESARIIISHVIRGIEKAKKYKVPEPIIDFIRTHHGTTTVQYFYNSYLKTYPEKIVDKSEFSYPGPIPFSKETAILMMADSVEAASRSLQKPDAEKIDKLVEDIINYQIKEGQFDNSNITFRDITEIKKIFKKRLMSIYHIRIEYPKNPR